MFRQFSNAQAIKLFVSLWKISTPELTGPSDNCSGSAPCPLTDWSRTDSFHSIWLIVLIFFLFFQWVSSVFNSPVRMATTWVSSPRDRVALQPKKGNELFLSFLFFVSETDVEIQASVLRAHCSACHCSACLCSACPLLCVPTALLLTNSGNLP